MRLLGFDRYDRRVTLKALLLVGGVIAVAALAFVSAGGVDVAADKPHSWITYRLLHFAFGQSVGVRASGITPPTDLDSPARVRLGAQHFHLVCSNCHGGPGLGQSPLALSMEPRPQHLPAVIGQFSDAELFWILKHGVKFSAMPSWSTDSRDDEVWSMVAFARKLPKMTAAEYLNLTTPQPEPAGASVPPFSTPATLHPADTARNPSWQAPEEYLYAVPALGFGDRTAMTNAVALCSRCHGQDGTGGITGGEAPNLTIQDPEYIRASLEAYATGGRRSGFMQPIAAQLSDGQIAALADWYAGMPDTPLPPTTPANPEAEARGRKIATEGLTSVALPACATCHEGEARTRIGAPHLEGQSAAFLRLQLTAMRDHNRGSTRFWNPMPAVARHLVDADIDAVAAYYASRKPDDQPPAAALASAHPGVDGDRAKGEQIFGSVCARCHTPQALGDEEGDIPDLTLQLPRYVASALRAYRAGERQNSRMNLVAQDLDDGQIEALATYVGSLKPQASRAAARSGVSARGEAIAQNGIADRKVPACLGCHGAGTTAALPLIPRLQGQNAEYLRKKLDYFAGPQATAISVLNPMPAIARNLTEAERADLAAYFAAGGPAEKQAASN